MTDDELNEHIKSVYAHFGLAMYLSQVLEHGIVNALFFMDLLPRARQVATKQTWADTADAFFDTQFRHTLGRMLQNLRTVTTVPADLEELLTKALERRNWLAHHFFRERSDEFMSHHGRGEMIAELEEAQRLFRTADEALEAMAQPLMNKYGYTKERVNEALQELLVKANSDL